MGGHKHIERAIGSYIASHYRSTAEIGVGNNFEVALILFKEGKSIFCTDIKQPKETSGIPFVIDDLFSPDLSLYRNVDLIYAIRPGEEMIPALIALAHQVDCDLIVYYLGFEGFGGKGEIIDCGVILYRYSKGQKPSKSLF